MAKELLPEQLKEALSLLKQLKKGYEDLGKENPLKGIDATNLENFIKGAGGVKNVLKQWTIELDVVETQLEDLGKSAKGVFTQFSNIVGEIKKSNQNLNLGNKAISSLQGIAEKLKNDQQGITELNKKDLLTLLQKQKQAVSNLDIANKALKNQIDRGLLEGKELENAKSLVAEREKEATAISDLNKLLQKRLEEEEKIESKTGLSGKLLEGFKKIPVLGDVLDVDGAKTAMRDAAKTGASGFSTLGTGIKALGPSLTAALGPLAIITTIVSAFKALIDLMFEADKQVTDLAKSLNVSKDEARDVRDRFFEIADNASLFGKIQEGNLILQKDLVETQLQLNQALGIAVDLSQTQNEDFAVQLTNARKFLKLNEEETKGLVGLYSTTGKSIDEIKNSVLGTTRLRKIESGIMLDERKILKDVLTTSNAIKLSVKGGVEGLTKAAMAAAELGSDLKTVENISKGLLNFEESISSELEAELLIGRDLNLETARRAALNGDLETVAREINRQVGSSADFSRMNVIQQEALAKAMGTSRDELADMLVQQENLNKLRSRFNVLGAKTIQNLFDEQKINKTTFDRLSGGTASATEYYDALKQAGMAQKEIVELLGDEAAQSLESQSAQDKFNDALEKAKEIFTRFVDGESLDKFADFISRFVESVSRKGLGNTLLFGMDSESDIAKSKAEEYSKKAASEEDASKKEEFIKKAKEQVQIYQEALKRENDKYMEEAKSGAMGVEQRKAAEVIERSKRGESGIMYAGSGPKFADGGMITKPVYNATIGEAGPEAVVPLNEFYAKLDQLIIAVKQGGNVYLDLQKVGSTTDQGTYRLNS
jgi:hypothetical protein